MKEKVIRDKELIKKIVGKDATELVIEFDKVSKKAYFKTNTMTKKLPIHISRVKDL